MLKWNEGAVDMTVSSHPYRNLAGRWCFYFSMLHNQKKHQQKA